jgi:hypothetical protein
MVNPQTVYDTIMIVFRFIVNLDSNITTFRTIKESGDLKQQVFQDFNYLFTINT